MINVNELMLGNYVFANNKIRQIVGIYPGGIDYVENDEVFGSLSVDVKPIQITSDMLRRLGFSEDEPEVFSKRMFLNISEFNKFITFNTRTNEIKFVCSDFDCKATVKYVHQLQNLVKLLTKQTLTLDSTGGEL